MKAKVTLFARVRNGEGGFGFDKVQVKRGRPVEPESATTYYLRYTENGKRRMEPVGAYLDEAYTALLNREVRMESIKRGLPVPTTPGKTDSDRTAIADAVEQFRKKLVAQDRSRATLTAYTKTVESFRDTCGRRYFDEVGKHEILDYINWCREHLQRRKLGEQNRTLRNRLCYLSVFFNEFGQKMPLATRDWPKVTKRNPDRYSHDTVNKLLAVADTDKTDFILFMLYTGFRDEEAAYSKYSDIDWKKGTINVHDKPEYGWTVKDREQRPVDIPLDAEFLKRLKARRERRPTCELIFPTIHGTPDMHLIKRVQRVAKKAGVKERITLHKFRRTFGTLYAKKFGVRTAQKLLGHSDIQTTMGYLAADELDTPQARRAAREVFVGIATK